MHERALAKMRRATFNGPRVAMPDSPFEIALQSARRLIASAPPADARETLVQRALLDAIDRRALTPIALANEPANDTERWAFLSSLSHDLRDPLAAVVMGATYLAKPKGLDDPVRSRRMVEAILRSAARMTGLVRNCSDFVHVVSGRLRLEFLENDANQVLAKVTARLEEQAKEKGISFAHENADAPMPVVLDEVHVEIAITQLLLNAIRHSPKGASVTVRATSVGANVEIDVADVGSGMSQERLDHFFDRYWHARQQTREGTGLGVAIARGMIDAHGGTMRVASSDRGTTVTIALPRAGNVANA